MGGTYVTHHFGYVLGELQRYKMDRDLIVSHQEGYENNYYTLNVEGISGNKRVFPPELNA
jgi:hypothetical protein